MKMKQHLRLLVLFLAVGALALPAVSQACGGKKKCGGCYRGGMIYNQTDGRYYSVPSGKSNMVYRSVDGQLIPVGKYGYNSCKRHHYRYVSGVRCQATPGWWWNTTWMPAGQECWYTIR